MSAEFEIRKINSQDQGWVARLLTEQWGSTKIITRGTIHLADRLSGFAAFLKSQPVGLITYRITESQCEIITLNSLLPGQGIGSALISAVRELAASAGCRRLWLITTNDNFSALRFFQKRGFCLSAVYPDAIQKSRRLKPEIPLIGGEGILLRDELELELSLTAKPTSPSKKSLIEVKRSKHGQIG